MKPCSVLLLPPCPPSSSWLFSILQPGGEWEKAAKGMTGRRKRFCQVPSTTIHRSLPSSTFLKEIEVPRPPYSSDMTHFASFQIPSADKVKKGRHISPAPSLFPLLLGILFPGRDRRKRFPLVLHGPRIEPSPDMDVRGLAICVREAPTYLPTLHPIPRSRMTRLNIFHISYSPPFPFPPAGNFVTFFSYNIARSRALSLGSLYERRRPPLTRLPFPCV